MPKAMEVIPMFWGTDDITKMVSAVTDGGHMGCVL